jgi:ACT domain
MLRIGFRSKDLSIPNKGISVPEEVREILTRNYAMYQCLKMKIINFHSLAELIQKQVQEVTGRKASVNTLVVAIKRFSDTLQDNKNPGASKVLKGARISLSSDIVDVTIKAPRTQFSKIVIELSQAANELSEFPNIFPLTNSIKMILPAEDYNIIRARNGGLDIASTRPNVAKVMLSMPSTSEMTPGIASYLTELLYRNGVNILDAFLGYGDIVIVVDERDGPLAYDILHKETRISDDLDRSP